MLLVPICEVGCGRKIFFATSQKFRLYLQQVALLGFFPNSFAAACFEPTSVGLHRDPGSLKDTRFTDWATAPPLRDETSFNSFFANKGFFEWMVRNINSKLPVIKFSVSKKKRPLWLHQIVGGSTGPGYNLLQFHLIEKYKLKQAEVSSFRLNLLRQVCHLQFAPKSILPILYILYFGGLSKR